MSGLNKLKEQNNYVFFIMNAVAVIRLLI